MKKFPEELGLGGLGSHMEKPQHIRSSMCLLYMIEGEAGNTTAEHGGRLLYSDKQERWVSTWLNKEMGQLTSVEASPGESFAVPMGLRHSSS